MLNDGVLKLAFEIQERLNELQRITQELTKRLTTSGGEGGEQPPPGEPMAGVTSEGSQPPGPPKPDASMGSFTLLELRKGDFRRTKPWTVQCRDEPPIRVDDWKDVVEEIVRWHIQNGRIKGNTPPPGAGRRYPVVSRDKNALSQSIGPSDYVQVDGWWVDTWGRADGAKSRNLVAICRSVGTNPADFKVTIRP